MSVLDQGFLTTPYLVCNKNGELQHPLPPLRGVHLDPPALPNGGGLQGVAVRQTHKQLDAEVVHLVRDSHLRGSAIHAHIHVAHAGVVGPAHCTQVRMLQVRTNKPGRESAATGGSERYNERGHTYFKRMYNLIDYSLQLKEALVSMQNTKYSLYIM